MFEYDHTLLNLPQLHRLGIRTTKELEEVIEGYSFADEIFLEELGYRVIRFIGFTQSSRSLKIACRLERDGKIVTLDAQIPSVEEIVSDFCEYC
jgi:hypothetical protein